MLNKKTALQQSIDEARAFLNGDETQAETHIIKVMPAPQYDAEMIKAVRRDLDVTQRTFASYLSVSTRTVESWETGKSFPNRSASRLIELIVKDPNIIKLIEA